MATKQTSQTIEQMQRDIEEIKQHVILKQNEVLEQVLITIIYSAIGCTLAMILSGVIWA